MYDLPTNQTGLKRRLTILAVTSYCSKAICVPEMGISKDITDQISVIRLRDERNRLLDGAAADKSAFPQGKAKIWCVYPTRLGNCPPFCRYRACTPWCGKDRKSLAVNFSKGMGHRISERWRRLKSGRTFVLARGERLTTMLTRAFQSTLRIIRRSTPSDDSIAYAAGVEAGDRLNFMRLQRQQRLLRPTAKHEL